MCEVEFFGRCLGVTKVLRLFYSGVAAHKSLLPDRCPREFLYYLVRIVKVRLLSYTAVSGACTRQYAPARTATTLPEMPA